MELKDYQKHCINEVKVYLEHLAEFKAKYDKAVAIDLDIAFDFTRKAWEKATKKSLDAFQVVRFFEKKNGLGEYLPNFCIKVPTGGGKTLLATHTGDIHYIHAEDAKNFLMKDCGISPDAIAIKSSEIDDLEGIDLFSPECPICYIITKQALQEGWDCSFAYVLTIAK